MTTSVLVEKVNRLRSSGKVVVLAHNYQLGEVQDLADFTGDSLELSIKAAQQTQAEVIVFCGVRFMAETAALLAPGKTVLFPAPEAGCPMADMATPEKLRQMKLQHPDAAVVCYVNSTVEVKAESDICCTSANAEKIVRSIPVEKPILFVPDQNLGRNVQNITGRENMILWPGFCPTHMRILPEHVRRRREEFPEAVVMVHPECRPDVVALADAVLSTGGMCRYALESKAHTFIVGTESGIIHRLSKENPAKRFIAVSEQAVCPNMKQITLENIVWALENMQERISISSQVREAALRPIQRMLDLS